MSADLHVAPVSRNAVIHAFDALRVRMGSVDEQYAYASMRRRLIQFFRLHAPQQAEALADATLARLTRKVEGLLIDSFPAYVLSIARLVAHEARRSVVQQGAAAPSTSMAGDDAAAVVFAAQDAAAGDLLLAYFGGDARAARRVSLAATHGVSTQALRARALRTREAFERSVSVLDLNGTAFGAVRPHLSFVAASEQQ